MSWSVKGCSIGPGRHNYTSGAMYTIFVEGVSLLVDGCTTIPGMISGGSVTSR